MNSLDFTFSGAQLVALPSGGLFWPERSVLIVSDLHLGKAARLLPFGGAQLPPYEARETLVRLSDDIEATGARHVICLGDSFDAPGVDIELPEPDRLHIAALQAGRDWTWIEGNHDPGPVSLGGTHVTELDLAPLVLRHIAQPQAKPQAQGEVSGHYHPKARIVLRGRSLTRRCFLLDSARLILPAYGTFTGGLRSDSTILCDLMAPEAYAILIGPTLARIPMPRGDVTSPLRPATAR